jgi:hypothetical protein
MMEMHRKSGKAIRNKNIAGRRTNGWVINDHT